MTCKTILRWSLSQSSIYTSYLLRTFDNPLPDSAHTIPYPVSDSNAATGVSETPTRRSVPVINRFNPILGWLSITQCLVRRAAESVAFCVPDSNSL